MDSVSFLENKNLKKLLEIFRKNNKNLYVVGGAVRDFLLGLTPKKMDIDLCSAVSIQELVFMLEGSDFFVRPKSLMMGVVSIVCNEDSFEYAQFRKESYSNSHSHNPKQIEFVTSLEIDAMRRDFTINSINQEVIESCVSESSKFLAYEYNDLSLLELDHLKLKTVVDDILKSNLSFAETSSKYYFYDSITLVNCPIGTYYCNSVQMQILIKYNKKTYERILRYEPKKI